MSRFIDVDAHFHRMSPLGIRLDLLEHVVSSRTNTAPSRAHSVTPRRVTEKLLRVNASSCYASAKNIETRSCRIEHRVRFRDSLMSHDRANRERGNRAETSGDFDSR
jgi:hypothetical protein